MICLCCYVSSRRPSDVGYTVTYCSCTLLAGHTEPKSGYSINSLHAGVEHLQVAHTQIRPDIMWDYLDIMTVFLKQSFKNFILKKKKKSGQKTCEKLLSFNIGLYSIMNIKYPIKTSFQTFIH